MRSGRSGTDNTLGDGHMAGNISKVAFRELVKFKYPTHQMVFCTEEALKTLRYEGSEKL